MLKFNVQHSNARCTIDVESLQFNKQRFKRKILYDKVLIQAIMI